MLHKFLAELNSWLGTPYAHYQYEKKKGADCALFIADSLKEIGILKKLDYTYFARFWHMIGNTEVLLNHINNYIKNNFCEPFTLQEVNNYKIGDLITFKLRSKLTNHLGVYIGNEMMINSIVNRGVCVTPIFKKRISKIFRIIK